jgi:hypothetical protein
MFCEPFGKRLQHRGSTCIVLKIWENMNNNFKSRGCFAIIWFSKYFWLFFFALDSGLNPPKELASCELNAKDRIGVMPLVLQIMHEL